MILLKNLKKAISEDTFEPIEKGGELETYMASAVQSFLAQNFGIACETEVKT